MAKNRASGPLSRRGFLGSAFAGAAASLLPRQLLLPSRGRPDLPVPRNVGPRSSAAVYKLHSRDHLHAPRLFEPPASRKLENRVNLHTESPRSRFPSHGHWALAPLPWNSPPGTMRKHHSLPVGVCTRRGVSAAPRPVLEAIRDLRYPSETGGGNWAV